MRSRAQINGETASTSGTVAEVRRATAAILRQVRRVGYAEREPLGRSDLWIAKRWTLYVYAADGDGAREVGFLEIIV